MMCNGLKTKLGEDTICVVCENWAHAHYPVYAVTEEGAVSLPKQVADFRHDMEEALRYVLSNDLSLADLSVGEAGQVVEAAVKTAREVVFDDLVLTDLM